MHEKIKLSEENKITSYINTPLEESNISFIKTRFTAMQTQRRNVDKNWKLYQKMIDAAYESYWDERSSSVVPLASSLIELFVSDAKKLQTEYNFKADNWKFKSQAKAVEYAWKYDFRTQKRRKVFLKDEYNAAWFWTSFIYTWVERLNYKVHDAQSINKDWEYNFTEKEIIETNILVENLDIRYVYIDDKATSMENANDAIIIQYISKEKLRQFINNKAYKNINTIVDSQIKDNETFYTDEDNLYAGYIKLMLYWNLEKDYFSIVANWKTLIREHYIIDTMNWKKAIPIVMRWLWYKNWLYYRWLCEACIVFNSEINNFREILMDWVRRSNNQTLLIWNWLTFNWREFWYNNEILKFNWNLNWNFQQVSWNPPNQAIFNYLDRLYRDIAVYVWIDIQNIMWQPQQTAFQTEVQREASQKRVNVWLENRDLAYERFADLYKDLLQKYFVYTLWFDWDEKNLPEITIEGWEFDKKWNYKQIKWSSIFKVNPEALRWEIMIDVYTNTTAPTINAVDRAQKLELINSISQFTQWYMLAKQAWEDIESILPFKKTLEELANDFNISTENNAWDVNLKDKKAEFIKKLTDIQKTWLSTWKWEMQAQNLEQNIPNQ